MGKTHLVTIFIFSPVATFDEQLLAMKLFAWRDALGISDARRFLIVYYENQ
jgi:hypothetical protein